MSGSEVYTCGKAYILWLQFHYQEEYIDAPSNKKFYDKYKYDIPVVHINGTYLMKHRVNEWLLRRALDRFSKN